MVLVMHAGLTSTNAAQLVLESIASKVVQHVRVKQGVSGVAARSEPKYGVKRWMKAQLVPAGAAPQNTCLAASE